MLLPDPLVYRSLGRRRPIALQRHLVRDKKCAGCHPQNPYEAVSSDVG